MGILSRESWSQSATAEAKIEQELSAEALAHRKAIAARKEAERLRREADEAKDAHETRWRRRQEEKARFTDAQREWWDEEITRARQLAFAYDTEGNQKGTVEALEREQDEWEHRKLEGYESKKKELEMFDQLFAGMHADEVAKRKEEWANEQASRHAIEAEARMMHKDEWRRRDEETRQEAEQRAFQNEDAERYRKEQSKTLMKNEASRQAVDDAAAAKAAEDARQALVFEKSLREKREMQDAYRKDARKRFAEDRATREQREGLEGSKQKEWLEAHKRKELIDEKRSQLMHEATRARGATAVNRKIEQHRFDTAQQQRLRVQSERARTAAKADAKMFKRLKEEKEKEEKQFGESQKHIAEATKALAVSSMAEASAAINHENLIERETRGIALKERHEKIGQENFAAALAEQEKQRREFDALNQRYATIDKIEAEKEARRRANAQAKMQLANVAKAKSQAKAWDARDKFLNGEEARKVAEIDRQELEKSLSLSKQQTEQQRLQLFMRDEAARASLAQHKAAMSNEKLKEGKARQKALEDERKAAERAEKRKKDEARKEFHEAQRRKAAESALVKERQKRLLDEKKAADAMRAVEIAALEVSHAAARERTAKADLMRVTNGTSPTSASGMRTQHESKMRATYGAGEQPSQGLLKFW